MAMRAKATVDAELGRSGIHADVGVRLAAARQAAGMSQSAAARQLGVAQSRVAKLEIGTRRLLYVEALQFAELYRLKLNRLDPRSEPSKPQRSRA